MPRKWGGLLHLAFFAGVGESDEGSLRARVAVAGLLSVRMIDHWILAGPVIAEPESKSVESIRNAISALPSDHAHRPALFGLINAMQTSSVVDIVPLLPYLTAYADLLDGEEWSKPMAYDLCLTIQRLQAEQADEDAEIELLATLLEAMDAPVDRSKKKSTKKKKPKRN